MGSAGRANRSGCTAYYADRGLLLASLAALMGICNCEWLDPPLLRLATIRLATADRIHVGHDYYGLEMFALTMYARAYSEAEALGDKQVGH